MSQNYINLTSSKWKCVVFGATLYVIFEYDYITSILPIVVSNKFDEASSKLHQTSEVFCSDTCCIYTSVQRLVAFFIGAVSEFAVVVAIVKNSCVTSR